MDEAKRGLIVNNPQSKRYEAIEQVLRRDGANYVHIDHMRLSKDRPDVYSAQIYGSNEVAMEALTSVFDPSINESMQLLNTVCAEWLEGLEEDSA